jgi:hypothetical protein
MFYQTFEVFTAVKIMLCSDGLLYRVIWLVFTNVHEEGIAPTFRIYWILTSCRLVVKIKESRNRPGVARGVAGDLGSQIFMTFGT